ncbi:MAG: glycosyltransferase family 4 protein [bacterium]|nr:glycosyltransferase family 4 protein [bacterium]
MPREDGERLAIDFVSPLPPVRSGIADYSADLLPHLGELCDLRLVRLEDQPTAPEITGRWEVVGPERLGEGGRLPLYQMGNNQYHTEVYDLAMGRPGVLTLHDMVLHHFLIDRTVKLGDFESYRRQLLEDHGWVGEAAAMPMRWPGGSGMAAQFALPAHRSLVSRQIGILTHSHWAADWLREELGDVRVRSIPMGVPLGRQADAEAGQEFRRRHGLPLDRPLLGSFGFQTPMKRTDVVISTLAAPELEGVHLMVGGEVAPILELEKRAAEAGVADRVHFLGFLPFEEFEAAIAASDLCLNLRYPTAGETSASLLRILAIGRPAVVSDYAQSAELPDEGVIKVPVGEGESAVLARRLADLLAEPDGLRRLGRAARRHVAESHRPEAAARAVIEACRDWRREPLPEATTVEPEAPTSMAWKTLPGELAVMGAEAPWREGERRRLEIKLANRSAARWLAGERLDGGVAIEVQVLSDGHNLRADHRWIGLPVDLDPGEDFVFHFDLRRPLGPVRLRILPHVLGFTSFPDLAGPVWDAEI